MSYLDDAAGGKWAPPGDPSRARMWPDEIVPRPGDVVQTWTRNSGCWPIVSEPFEWAADSTLNPAEAVRRIVPREEVPRWGARVRPAAAQGAAG